MLATGVVPLLVLVLSGSAGILNPKRSAWLGTGDSAQHYVGWEFYSRADTPGSISRIEAWPYPMGTTIGLSDSIPLLAIPLRSIVRPDPASTAAQYFGLWIALCAFLTAAAAAAVLLETGGSRILAVGGGALAGLSPVLWDRAFRGHFSLCAQFLVLAQIWIWLRAVRPPAGRATVLFAGAGAVVVLSAFIHPYLTLITLVLLVGMAVDFVRRDRSAALRLAILVGAVFAAAVALFEVCGFTGVTGGLDAGGFGSYRFDLGGLLNPANGSRFFGPLFRDESGGEGFAYLGLGALLVFAVSLVRGLAGRSPKTAAEASALAFAGWPPIAMTAIVLAMIGALPSVNLFGYEILDLGSMDFVESYWLSAARSLGRLAWPLHFVVLLGIVRCLEAAGVRRGGAALVLGLAIAVQAVELEFPRAWAERGSVAWAEEIAAAAGGLPGRHRHLALVPPFLADGGGVHCGDRWSERAWVPVSLAAARLGWTSNSGYVARMDPALRLQACREAELETLLAEGGDPATVYVLRERRRKAIRTVRRFASARGWNCVAPHDNWTVCARKPS